MHGLGNDFVLVMAQDLPTLPMGELASQLCHRHFGIGADGLVILGAGGLAPWRMQIFNADGSEAEMCGNALRCVGKFLYEEGLVQEQELVLEGYGGTIIPLRLTVQQDLVVQVTVDMGSPIFTPAEVPILSQEAMVVNQPVVLAGQEFLFTAVSIGNPHCVIFTHNLKDVLLEQWGPQLESCSLFPNKTNVEFVEVLSPKLAKVLVWERGVGPTLACGSGASAVLAAGVVTGMLDRAAEIQLPGGSLSITWGEDNRLLMTGPAVKVFSGEYNPKGA
jgi:diaminopimelate epimerase